MENSLKECVWYTVRELYWISGFSWVVNKQNPILCVSELMEESEDNRDQEETGMKRIWLRREP